MSSAYFKRLVELRRRALDTGCPRRWLAYSRLRDNPGLVRVSLSKLSDPAFRR